MLVQRVFTLGNVFSGHNGPETGIIAFTDLEMAQKQA